jgi:hypothetical protein
MLSDKRTISVRLGPEAQRRLEKAASLVRQSRAAFLEEAGDERARRILLDWAAQRHREGNASFSELAQETGLAVEEIMVAVGAQDQDRALEAFLASCRTVAELENNPAFLRLGEEAVDHVRRTSAARRD